MAAILDHLRGILQERAEEGQFELPVLPQVASQVLQMAADEKSDAAKISALVHRDQALAGHFLKIANSVAFGGAVKIVSLQQAIARLGLDVLTEIAVAACVRGRVFALAGREAEMGELWRSAVASAACAKEIARASRRNVESAFLCGLLHDVGKPLVLLVLHDLPKRFGEVPEGDDLWLLLEEFSPLYGSILAERWELPDVVRAVVSHFRSWNEAPVFAQEARVTALADRLGRHMLDPEVHREESLRSDPLFGALNFYPEDVDALLAKRDSVLQLVSSMAL